MTASAFELPPEKQEVCADLRDEAAQSGLSYRAIAREAYASPAAVSLVMNGRRWPSPRMFEAIVEAMTGKKHGGHLAEKYAKAAGGAALALLLLLGAARGITARVSPAPDCPPHKPGCAIVDSGRHAGPSDEVTLAPGDQLGIAVYAGPYDRHPVRYIHDKISVTLVCGDNVMSGLTNRYLVSTRSQEFWVDKVTITQHLDWLPPECGR
ncbi:helix-turn-helix transcriptional regulator [Streptomyces sp. NPDC093260]|uniref:helix-turn-helix domain-containing protein n=1 Tax=Streptomyces sp. NPDC093260 TaxID=3155073 RepID=UPI00342CBF26